MPSSKLSAYCDKVIEMGWLAAVVAAPLFFNVYSSRVFEPDKLTTVRSIAVVMGIAWLVKWIEGLTQSPRPRSEVTWRTPMVIPTLILVVSYLISTAFSVAPSTSLWGSYQRLQGTYTTFSYIVIFLLILQGLRDKRQLDRLVTTIIITSLPIALYGLIQRYKLDPLPWGGDVTTRVASNMGNAIFVAAYLIMAFFLTVGRIMESFQAILTEEEAYLSDILRASAYVFIAAVHLITIVFSVSRGPFIGLLAGVFILGVILLAELRRRASQNDGEGKAGIGLLVKRWLWLGWILAAVFALGFFWVFNLPDTPLASLRKTPIVRRLFRIDPDSNTGQVRLLIWEGAARLAWWHEPIRFPDGEADPYNAIRPLVGYGPESMYVAYNRFYPPELAHHEKRNASPDRSHNETFDALVITGLIGLLAEQVVFMSVFLYAFRWIGLVPGKRERNLFIGLWTSGAVLGAIVLGTLGGVRYIGMSVPIGNIVSALVIYPAIIALFHKPAEEESTSRSPYYFLLIGLLGVFVAHYVEIHFGIAIASTRTLFWTFVGVLVVVGSGWVREPEAVGAEATGVPTPSAQSEPGVSSRRRRRRKARRTPQVEHTVPEAKSLMPAWAGTIGGYALIGALILSTLFYEFVTNSERLADPVRIVWQALTTIAVRGSRTSYAILGMITLVWLIGGLMILAELSRSKVLRKSEDIISGTLVYYLVSLSLAVIFALALASHLGGLTQVQARAIDEVVQIADQVAAILTYYYGLVFLTIFVAAGFLLAEEQLTGVPIARGVGAVFMPFALVVALAVVSYTNMNPIRADIIYKQGDPWDKQKQWDASIAHYKRAIQLAPSEDFYYLWLGRAFLKKANAAKNTETLLLSEQTKADAVLKMNVQQTAQLSRQDLLMAARAVLIRAREINPLNTDHSANLARLYRRWADLAQTPDAKQKRSDQSIAYYQDATDLSPQNAVLWNEWATVYLYLKGDIEAALERITHSLELDSQFEQTYMIMGDLYMNQKELDKAAEAYENALEIQPGLNQARNVLCYLYAQQDKREEAIACNQELVSRTPNDWNAYKNMAILYDQEGELEEALLQAQTARSKAPEDQQQALDTYIAQLQARLSQPAPPAPVITPTTP